MNDDLKVVSMLGFEGQIYGLTEEGSIAVFNPNMGFWVHRASAQIKSQADGNEFMKKMPLPEAQLFMSRHSFDPGEIIEPVPTESWFIEHFWLIFMGGIIITIIGWFALFTKV